MYWTLWSSIGMWIAEGGYLHHAIIIISVLLVIAITAKLAYTHGKNIGFSCCTECRFWDSECGHKYRAHREVDNGCIMCDDTPCNCVPF